MKENIDNRNTKGQRHGHRQWYWDNGVLTYRGNWKNGQEFGYQEWHLRQKTIYNIR